MTGMLFEHIETCGKQLQYTFNGSNTDGSFTMAVSNSFLSLLEKNTIKCRFGIIQGDLLFMYSLESPLLGDSNEKTQHTFMLKKIEKIFLLCLLAWCYD